MHGTFYEDGTDGAGTTEDVEVRLPSLLAGWDSDARFRAIVNDAAEGIVTIDESGTIGFMNAAAERTFGFARGEMLGHCVSQLAAPPHRGWRPTDVARFLTMVESDVIRGSHELEGQRKDGSVFPLHVAVSEFYVAGGRFFTGMLRDLTAQRQVEEQLRRAKAAAESANQAKTDFLATVSHEMRTPMNAIIGMSELALVSRSPAEQHDFIQRVQANAEALLHLINGMLDLSKIEAQQLDFHPEPVDVAALVEEVTDELHVRASAKNLEMVCDIAPDLPARLLVDPNRLRQILVNLVGNAVKFTDAGEVCLRAFVDGWNGETVRLHFLVVDTGIGIGPEDQKRVFDKFFQADASTTRRFGGTGLGLTITQSLVQAMGGSMTLESEPGCGTTFGVQLPLAVADATPCVVAQPPSTVTRVLMVEANASAVLAARRVLEHRGYLVEAVAESAEAVRRLQEGPDRVNVLLVDQTVDGGASAVIRALRSRSENATSRVVLLAGYGGAAVDEQIDARLIKPLGGPRLVAGVERVLGRQSVPGADHAVSPRRNTAPARCHRILLAEDCPDNQVVTSHTLTRAGYQVDVVDNGQRAVERSADYPYDLILMDVEMPEMDGFQATQRIRERESLRSAERVPIVAVTAHALEGFRQRCLDAGMDDYAAKPVTRQRLVELAEKWIDNRPLVLVADDSADSRHLLRSIVTRDGRFRVMLARDGREALDLAARRRFAAVLLDMEMPLLDGYATAAALRARPQGDQLLIIALTGNEGPNEERKCREAGCSDYLLKPIRTRDLLEALDPVAHTDFPTRGTELAVADG
ncbi:MAG: response regulator [Deltaproteobacteria bacterium]|nr:response regulator [Deltaproteobacteria bacterium]